MAADDAGRSALKTAATPAKSRSVTAETNDGGHIVAPGDTLLAIAHAYRVRWSEIVALNGMVPPFALRPGQRLRLPPGQRANQTAPGGDLEKRAAAFTIDLDPIISRSRSETGATRQPQARGTSAESPPTTASFIWPAAGRVVSRFGPRGRGEINDGIDISVGQRAEIRAAASGTIEYAGSDVAVYGGLILIRHTGGWMTAYGRIADAKVKSGQAVSRGDIIGFTGSGAMPRLFFQMRKDRIPVDPVPRLPPR